MQSMTGFGLGEAAFGEGRLTLELRALNHRFLDVRVRLPNEIADQTSFLEQLARERLSRGRFELGVRVVGAALPVSRFSHERARALYAALLELQIPQLDPDRAFEWSPALFDAYATVLEELGRDGEAAEWFARSERAAEALATAADPDGGDIVEIVEEEDA